MKTSKIMGILNVTPDSTSETGKYFNHEDALRHVKEMIAHGVDVIDVGAETTRPGGTAVSIEEEIRRLSVLPKIKTLLKGTRIQISLDSRNYETILHYIDYIDIINDVSGFYNELLQDLALKHNKRVVLMHSLSVPVVEGEFIQSDDIIGYLQEWLINRLAELGAKGFKLNQIIFDPGVGFGTNTEQSITIIKNVKFFMTCGVGVLIGHSRKRFLSIFGESLYDKRDPETHAITFYLAQAGVDYLRIHDVAASKRLVKMAQVF